ncbi:hypothetical protein GJ496_000560 [Pomphorhynchus laevis]|nr:hypothetical protein GJ496_000560 [Pomphorhynchus laevis]
MTRQLNSLTELSIAELIFDLIQSIESVQKNEDKYYIQRYRLFSRFDEGIVLDEEAWYSVTPEEIAYHVATLVPNTNSIICDVFCGAGSNLAHFINTSQYSIGLDINFERLILSKNTVHIYNRDSLHSYDVVCADAFMIGRLFRKGLIEFIHVSPPWGGPSYLQRSVYCLDLKFKSLLENCCDMCQSTVVAYLPKNTSLDWLMQISIFAKIKVTCVEQIFLNQKLKALLVYFRNK